MAWTGGDVEMAQLNLRLRPCQRGRPFEGVGVLMLVDDIEQRLARSRHDRPEGDTRHAARRNPHAPAQREYRIEHGSDGVGEAPSVQHRDGIADVVAAAEKAGAIGLDLDLADRLALDDREMGSPQLGFARAAAPTRRQDGAGRGEVLGLHEQLGKGLVRRIGQRRRQRDLGKGGELDVARFAPGVGDRDAPDLGIVLGRHDDIERGGEDPVVPHEFRPILGEHHVIAVGPCAARLIGGRPHLAAGDIAQQDIAAPIVAASCPRASA